MDIGGSRREGQAMGGARARGCLRTGEPIRRAAGGQWGESSQQGLTEAATTAANRREMKGHKLKSRGLLQSQE